MKRLILFLIILFEIPVFSLEKPLEIVSFNYPPYMGKSKVSEEGLLNELVVAAFESVGVVAIPNTVPLKRGKYQMESNKSLVYIGITDTFDSDFISNLRVYPLMNLTFQLFFLKERFPLSFSFDVYKDLKPYKIGVLGGGITERIGDENGLNLISLNNVYSIFEKVRLKKVDFGIAVDLSIDMYLDELYKKDKFKFSKYLKKSFLSIDTVVVLNKKHPDYPKYKNLLEKGLIKIVENGKWKEISEKYYGANKVPKEAFEVIENTINNFK